LLWFFLKVGPSNSQKHTHTHTHTHLSGFGGPGRFFCLFGPDDNSPSTPAWRVSDTQLRCTAPRANAVGTVTFSVHRTDAPERATTVAGGVTYEYTAAAKPVSSAGSGSGSGGSGGSAGKLTSGTIRLLNPSTVPERGGISVSVYLDASTAPDFPDPAWTLWTCVFSFPHDVKRVVRGVRRARAVIVCPAPALPGSEG
jgi:hypothetical protein